MRLRPGVYEALITEGMARSLTELEAAGHPVDRRHDAEDRFDEALARHVYEHVLMQLRDLPRGQRTERIELTRRLLDTLVARAPDLQPVIPAEAGETLFWIGEPRFASLGGDAPPERPQHGLVHPSLILNGRQDVSLVAELRRELESAEEVDAVVAFLKWSGLRLLQADLRRFFDRRGEMRMLVSTYTGVSDPRAIEALARMGARVRVAREEDGTRLHAKAWLFRRSGNLSTAYIGSSNLSGPALTDGAEWNVRVTEARTPDLLERFAAAFEQLWESCRRDFRPGHDTPELITALRRAGGGDREGSDVPFLAIEAVPRPHQERVLDALAAERERGHHHNLVVAATGTGKTWVAAFDYRRSCEGRERPRLLFVAHRKEILKQSLGVYRSVLQDPNFGELFVGGQRPSRGTHVFASIQSLDALGTDRIDPRAYDVVVVDEFHHAAARTYQELLSHLSPQILLGLTATPERLDGIDVTSWFDHRVAAEIRLWDALEQDLLVPFHYFGVDDPTSAERAWRRGRLDPGVLDGIYSGDDVRAQRVMQAVQRYVGDARGMRALGFCVGVNHAERMARAFVDADLPAVAVHGRTPAAEREDALRRLASGELCALFTVDLFNEGVDVPSVDTVLFLRPTESATIFLQQLGRGLRRAPGKSVLTVLDFVGHVHADFRYEARFQALLGSTRQELEQHLTAGFPRLPAGCAIQLERAVEERVLTSIRRAIRGGWRALVAALRAMGPETTLQAFLDETRIELTELYRNSTRTGWTALRRDAGFETRPAAEGEEVYARRIARTLHIDDRLRLGTWADWLKRDESPEVDRLDARELALVRMLTVLVGDRRAPLTELSSELERFWRDQAPLREEFAQLLDVLDDRLRHTTRPFEGEAPLRVHGTYTRDEIVAAWGLEANGRLREVREGVAYDEERRVELMFVTLDKSDDAFRPTIRYSDYPISADRFHWESQNRTSEASPTGQRYIRHAAQGVGMMLFVRARRKDQRGATLAYTFLGPVRYLRHRGERPMQIEWQLEVPMPAWVRTEGSAVVA